MPKNVKGGPLGFCNINFVAKYQKFKGDPLETFKNFRKKACNAEKNRKGVPFSLVQFCMLKPIEGTIFTTLEMRFRWPNMAGTVTTCG